MAPMRQISHRTMPNAHTSLMTVNSLYLRHTRQRHDGNGRVSRVWRMVAAVEWVWLRLGSLTCMAVVVTMDEDAV